MCWVISMSILPLRRSWASCRNSTSCIADSEWSSVISRTSVKLNNSWCGQKSSNSSDCWTLEKKSENKDRGSILTASLFRFLSMNPFRNRGVRAVFWGVVLKIMNITELFIWNVQNERKKEGTCVLSLVWIQGFSLSFEENVKIFNKNIKICCNIRHKYILQCCVVVKVLCYSL